MDWSLAATGVGVGFALAAPIGPVNIMCVHRAVRTGFWAGLSAGAGAAVADTLCAAIAAFGFSAVELFVEGHLDGLKLFGGILLVIFGVVIGLRKPRDDGRTESDSALSLVGAAVASFVLAISNPALLLGAVAIFGGLAEIEAAPRNAAEAATTVAGVAVGSVCWWVLISGLVARYREKLTPRHLGLVNIVSGIALAVFGGVVLVDLTLRRFF